MNRRCPGFNYERGSEGEYVLIEGARRRSCEEWIGSEVDIQKILNLDEIPVEPCQLWIEDLKMCKTIDCMMN